MWIRCQDGMYLNLNQCMHYGVTRDRSKDAGPDDFTLKAMLCVIGPDGVVTQVICEGSHAECSKALQRIKDLTGCIDLDM